jgi:hypothetical protein
VLYAVGLSNGCRDINFKNNVRVAHHIPSEHLFASVISRRENVFKISCVNFENRCWFWNNTSLKEHDVNKHRSRFSVHNYSASWIKCPKYWKETLVQFAAGTAAPVRTTHGFRKFPPSVVAGECRVQNPQIVRVPIKSWTFTTKEMWVIPCQISAKLKPWLIWNKEEFMVIQRDK